MIDHLQSGRHMDADQLSAFAEGVLPEHERAFCMAHFADCPQCREIAFLAQKAEPVADVAAVATRDETSAVPFWRRWLSPMPLTGVAAAFACLLVVFVMLRPHPETQTTPQELAVAKPVPDLLPPPPPAMMQSAPAPKKLEQQPAKPDAEPSPSLEAKADKIPQSIKMAEQAQTATMDRAAPAAMAATPPPVTGGMAKAQPLADRPIAGSFAAPVPKLNAEVATAAPAPPAPANSAAAFKQSPLAARAMAPARQQTADNSPLHLQIEHGVASLGDASQVNGVVRDPSGAVVPGALVSLRLQPSGPTHEAKTDSNGRFAVPALPAGKYLASINSPGFQNASQQFEIAPRDLVTMASTLQIGSSSQSVMVTSEAANLPVEGRSVGLLPCADDLPGKSQVSNCTTFGDRTLALDASGSLYIRHKIRKWKQVKPAWTGKVVVNTATSCPLASAPTITKCVPMFQIRTDAGATWLSADGEHWHQQ